MHKFCLFLTILFVGVTTTLIPTLIGEEPVPSKPQYSDTDVYAFFAKYTPEEVVKNAKAAGKFFTPIAEKAALLSPKEETKLFMKGLDQWHALPSNYPQTGYPLMFFTIPQRCDLAKTVAHYVPEFLVAMGKNGFLKKYRDIKGRKIAFELCQKIKTNKKGAWLLQYQWWPETSKPLYMGFFMIQIPGTPYQIQAFYPTKDYTTAQLNKRL